jgi:hypothetical protein
VISTVGETDTTFIRSTGTDVSALAAFAVAGFFATALHANPQPGPGQETYWTYYSDASHTTIVGFLLLGTTAPCAIHHVTQGTVTPYHTVTVANCDNGI